MWMKIKKLHENATVPHRAHHNDAGVDLFTIENGVIHAGKDGIIRSGISLAIPDGWVAIVKEKSGRATKNKISVGACVIDSGYRGEILIHVFNNDSEIPLTYQAGEKIVQLVVVQCWTGQPVEVDELEDSERGEGRMGSTGLTEKMGTSMGEVVAKTLRSDSGGEFAHDEQPTGWEDAWLENEAKYLSKRNHETRDDW
jgi:dUTP pyrophosphatase